MSATATRRRTAHLGGLAAAVVAACLSACDKAPTNRVQGYVEGEYVYIASPLAGTLEALSVARGTQVKEGDPLFALDGTPEQAAHDEATRRLAQGRASLEDARKGGRPSEIKAVEARLAQARAALEFSQTNLERLKQSQRSGAAADQEIDQAQSDRDQNFQRAAQAEADLATIRLGAREDQIAAAEENVRALEAALARADWDLSQKKQAAPEPGLVFDTLYREGEWVAAGRPVISLLPPRNVKVRAFVPEERLGPLKVGGTVHVIIDGVAAPLDGTISFVSPKSEYTPPVIYSRESRSKLVYMVEIEFAPETAAGLHPGQPVDVEIGQ